MRPAQPQTLTARLLADPRQTQMQTSPSLIWIPALATVWLLLPLQVLEMGPMASL